MLFSSLVFILAFLPISLFGYHWLRLSGRQFEAKLWMVANSLFFYGWWDWHYLALVCISIAANFLCSRIMEQNPDKAGRLLGAGVIANLALLGYYKYANFFVDTANFLTSSDWHLHHIVLPLAISFYTFQQIAYLIESRRDGRAADSFVDYALFVLFFPHLIAGPITHHKEMLPQFATLGAGRLPRSYVQVGTAIFVLGLAKKVLLADGFALLADPAFNVVRGGQILGSADAWLGALAYSLQLYFDFSGYSDMAIGLGLMFGVLLPVNFASPYKATSLVDFWRRIGRARRGLDTIFDYFDAARPTSQVPKVKVAKCWRADHGQVYRAHGPGFCRMQQTGRRATTQQEAVDVQAFVHQSLPGALHPGGKDKHLEVSRDDGIGAVDHVMQRAGRDHACSDIECSCGEGTVLRLAQRNRGEACDADRCLCIPEEAGDFDVASVRSVVAAQEIDPPAHCCIGKVVDQIGNARSTCSGRNSGRNRGGSSAALRYVGAFHAKRRWWPGKAVHLHRPAITCRAAG